MAGATPFLDGLLGAAERAGSRLPDLEGVHLRWGLRAGPR